MKICIFSHTAEHHFIGFTLQKVNVLNAIQFEISFCCKFSPKKKRKKKKPRVVNVSKSIKNQPSYKAPISKFFSIEIHQNIPTLNYLDIYYSE